MKHTLDDYLGALIALGIMLSLLAGIVYFFAVHIPRINAEARACRDRCFPQYSSLERGVCYCDSRWTVKE